MGEEVARFMLSHYGAQPDVFASAVLIVPSRRACRTIREAFMAVQGSDAPLLLPRILSIGDVEDNIDMLLASLLKGGNEERLAAWLTSEKPLSRTKRTIMLAKMIHDAVDGQERFFDGKINVSQAVHLAESLGDLLDDFYRDRVDVEVLRTIAGEEYAEHWQHSLEFLELIITRWPEWLAEHNALDEVERRNRAYDFLVSSWQSQPADYPVIMAGSTGSVKSAGALMAAIAKLPKGAVILPACDLEMDERIWGDVDVTHPQYMMQQWLEREGFSRADVAMISEGEGSPRVSLMQHVMLPATATEQWVEQPYEGVDKATQDVQVIACADEEEEATVIAHAMRLTLEEQGKDAALVTHNRPLARRVSALLGFYDIEVDDSVGMSLLQTPPAAFFMLVGEMVTARGSATSLLSVLKHPFCAMQCGAQEVRRVARLLDKALFRGVHAEDNFRYWRARIDAEDLRVDDDARALFVAMLDAVEPLASLMEKGMALSGELLLKEHITLVEVLSGEQSLWSHHAGQSLSQTLSNILLNLRHLPAVEPMEYLSVVEQFLGSKTYRKTFGVHPRLHILSPIEARMQHYDVMILGGLNEGSWPAEPTADPWVSRPMRSAIGVMTSDSGIGQAAHDFYTLAMHQKLILTRAQKEQGSPTIPSRWLLRLEACMQPDKAASGRIARDAAQAKSWAQIWLKGDAEQVVLQAPLPQPPESARPRQLSATGLERLIRNPYGYYANKILRLRALEDIARPLSAADFGNIIHDALERYYGEHSNGLKDGEAAAAALLDIGKELFADVIEQPSVALFWWPRFEHIVDWFVEREQEQYRDLRSKVISEETLEHSYELTDAGQVMLTSKVDRIERYQDGGTAIVDYKTGVIPAKKEVKAGIACQLPLGGLLWQVNHGGDDIMLTYWALKGGAGKDAICNALAKDATPDMTSDMMQDIEEKLRAFLGEYVRTDTVFLVSPIPEVAPIYDDYKHLSRVQEWNS